MIKKYLACGLILIAVAAAVYLVVAEGYENGIKAGVSAFDGNKFQTHSISSMPDFLDFLDDYRYWFATLFIWTMFAVRSFLTWIYSRRLISMLMFVTAVLSVLCDSLVLSYEAIDYFSIEALFVENSKVPISVQAFSYLLRISFSCLYFLKSDLLIPKLPSQ